MENTYTDDEIRDLMVDLSNVIGSEIESELINSSHTNVLMLQQVFGQAQKWHLDLEADLAELENRQDRKWLIEARVCKSYTSGNVAWSFMQLSCVGGQYVVSPLGAWEVVGDTGHELSILLRLCCSGNRSTATICSTNEKNKTPFYCRCLFKISRSLT
jgi:hypothetical protein